MTDYLERILLARVYDVAIESPLEEAGNLSRRLGNTLLLKREDMQPVFSFKLRGAYNKMAGLSRAQLKRGVVAASAGNHAQGVALSAQVLGCEATIVMPATTPAIKVDAVAKRGAQVVLHGDSYDDAYTQAKVIAKRDKKVFVHPYDDPEVIAGQGTIGMELLRQARTPIDAIFVPVGGGGLIAGIAAYIKRLKPEIKVIGVEPEDADAMARSLCKKERIVLPQVGLFADGVAVKQVGEETFRLCQLYVDEIIRVSNDAICAAIKDVFEDTRSILEPSGAMSVAAVKQYAATTGAKGQTLIAITCGANMNFDRLRFVAERAEVGERREALFAVTIPEARGSFKRFCELLGPRSVTEFNYRIADASVAHIFVGVAISKPDEAARLARTFSKAGFQTLDLTNDELAKQHVRHMVGGRSELARDERLFRFQFPERPGALMKFLSSMHPDWNISLFHYRNQGADHGRILVGIQVPRGDAPALRTFLSGLNYPFEDETANPAYRLFLA